MVQNLIPATFVISSLLIRLLSAEYGRLLLCPYTHAQSNHYHIHDGFFRFLRRFGYLMRHQEAGVVTATDDRGWSALVYAVASGRTTIVDIVVSLVECSLPPEQVRA